MAGSKSRIPRLRQALGLSAGFGLQKGMAPFRRALFGLLAAVALLCGLGWTAAALAYSPLSAIAAAPSDQTDDGCGQSAPHNCPIPYCGPVCLGVVPAVPAVEPLSNMRAAPYWIELQALHESVFGPEPPPPRGA
ncbi:MAG TPA: hypothetical protein VFW19_17765 [Allosphingosinicella sp.]|nr:hypothetical protein [Allosphingosinicella sp.]